MVTQSDNAKQNNVLPEQWTGVNIHHRKKVFPWFFAVLFGGFLLGSLVCFLLAFKLTKPEFPTREITAAEEPVTGSTSASVSWNDKNIWEKFTELRFGPSVFRSTGAFLPPERCTDYLGGSSLSTTNDLGEEEKELVSLYAVPGISRDCAVAASFNGYEEYYIYLTPDYLPDTLGNLVNDLNVLERLTLKDVTYYYRDKKGDIHEIKFDGIQEAPLFEALFSNDNAPCEKSYKSVDSGRTLTEITVSIPALGIAECSFWTTENGYLCTNVLGENLAFKIGDEVTAFTDYLLTAAKGYEPIPAAAAE